jgi:hypothetical protein
MVAITLGLMLQKPLTNAIQQLLVYLGAAGYYLAAKEVIVAATKVGDHASRFLNKDNATSHVPRVEAVLEKAIETAIGHVCQVYGGTAHAA